MKNRSPCEGEAWGLVGGWDPGILLPGPFQRVWGERAKAGEEEVSVLVPLALPCPNPPSLAFHQLPGQPSGSWPPHYCDGHPLSSRCCTVTSSRPCWVSRPSFLGGGGGKGWPVPVRAITELGGWFGAWRSFDTSRSPGQGSSISIQSTSLG